MSQKFSSEELRDGCTLVLTNVGPILEEPLTAEEDEFQSTPAFRPGIRVKLWGRVGRLDVASVPKGTNKAVVLEQLYSLVERTDDAIVNSFLIGSDGGETEFVFGLDGKEFDLAAACNLESIGDLGSDASNKVLIVSGSQRNSRLPLQVALDGNALALQSFLLSDQASLVPDWSAGANGSVVTIGVDSDGNHHTLARWPGAYRWQDFGLNAHKVFATRAGDFVLCLSDGNVIGFVYDPDADEIEFDELYTLKQGEQLACLSASGLVVSRNDGDEFKVVEINWLTDDI